MNHLFVYCNGPRRDVFFCRPLVRALIEHGGFTLTLGHCAGDADLWFDLVGPHSKLLPSDLPNTRRGAILDLATLCPPDAIALPVAPGRTLDVLSYQWPDALAGLRDALASRGLPDNLPADPQRVPLFDFVVPSPEPAPASLRAMPTIWLDLDHSGNHDCQFTYDLARLALALPDHQFACTRQAAWSSPRCLDVSGASAVQRSKWSEACVALVGTTPWPFHLTLTEPNRNRPRALCGYDARVSVPAWDYPANPTELMATMDDLVDFLIANVAQECSR